jgi:hypothetical protein
MMAQCEECFSWICHFHPNNNYWKSDPLIFQGRCKDQRMEDQQVIHQKAGEQ